MGTLFPRGICKPFIHIYTYDDVLPWRLAWPVPAGSFLVLDEGFVYGFCIYVVPLDIPADENRPDAFLQLEGAAAVGACKHDVHRYRRIRLAFDDVRGNDNLCLEKV